MRRLPSILPVFHGQDSLVMAAGGCINMRCFSFAAALCAVDHAPRDSDKCDLFLQGKLMTSWAVVCDVYFLEPQKKGEDESAQQFAERVQRLIAERAKLQIAPWDGYLKYYTLGVKVRLWAASHISHSPV